MKLSRKYTRRRRLRRLLLSGFSLLMLAGYLQLTGCEQFGARPEGDAYIRVSQSENYDASIDQFVNLDPDVLDEMSENMSFWSDPVAFLKSGFSFFTNKNQTRPDQPLPEVRVLPDDFGDSAGTIKFTWLGHATILMSIEEMTILVDPTFSPSAAPVSWAVKRFQPPAIDLESLPPIDAIIISHDHYDHLDMNTIKHFIATDTKFFVPLGVAAHLNRWGIPNNRITELDWWDSIAMQGLEFICMPAQHFSGRIGLFHNQTSLWASWMVRSSDHSVYFSGDSGYADHYRMIGERYGPFDLVFMDAGQYNARWRQVHNLPDEAVQAFQDLRGKAMVPTGWGMYTLALHDWFEPAVLVDRIGIELGLDVIIPRLGDMVDIAARRHRDRWWKPLMGTADDSD
jgi:L-ascorbate metabolism protein UlaG (beta-lactamase superfamily)